MWEMQVLRPVIVPYDTGIRDIHVSQSIHLPLNLHSWRPSA
jgi:hypothetical protein